MGMCIVVTHIHLLKQCSNKSAGICRSQTGTPLNTHTDMVYICTHSEQRAESPCQVARGGSRLRTGIEEEEKLLAGLESKLH